MKKTLFCIIVSLLVLFGVSAMAESYQPELFYKMDFNHPVNSNFLGAYPNGESFPAAALEAEAYFYRTEELTGDKGYGTAFVLYTDFQGIDEAWAALNASGLKELADEQKAVVVVAKKLGEAYGEADAELYKAFEMYIMSESTDNMFKAYTWNQRTFVFGAGEAADFIHNYFAGKNGHTAAVCAIGGNVTNKEGSLPMPAYLGSVNEETVNYYKALDNANEATTSDSGVLYLNAQESAKRVVVTSRGELNIEVAREFWKQIGQRTVRACLGQKIYLHYMENEHYLAELPIYDEMGIERIDHLEGVLEGANEIQEWYEYVPERVLGTDKKVPLLVVCHGSNDHPIFEAESQGWVGLMAKEDLFIVTLRHQALSDETKGADINKLTAYIVEKYPNIDAGRVYIAGFSMGGRAVGMALQDDMDLYAGAAVLHSRFDQDYSAYEGVKLPFAFTIGSRDTTFEMADVAHTIDTFLQQNDIERRTAEPSLDNLLGVGLDDAYEKQVRGLTYQVKQLTDSTGIPDVQISCLRNVTHMHFAGNAELIWPFLSQFSRAEDGSIAYVAHDLK